jgi:hypothetical protein
MTSKNLSANITIGGTVSSSLGKSFGAVKTALHDIGSEIKVIKQLTADLEKQAMAAKKAGKSVAEYEKEIARLAKRRSQLEGRQGGLKSISGMFSQPNKIQFGELSSMILGKMAASKSMGGATTSALGAIAEFGPMIAAVGTAAAAVAAALVAVAAGVFAIGRAAAGTIDKMADMADGLGVTTQSLQRLQYVAALSGIEADTFNTKLGKLQASIESSKGGTGAAADAINELGLSYQELSAMNPDEQLIALSTAFKQYNGSVPKITLGNALFGKNSAAFVNMMNQGGDAIRNTGKEAKVFSDGQIKDAEKFDRAWNTMTNAFEAVWVQLGSTFLPVVTSAVVDLKNYLSDPALKEDIAIIGEVFSNVFTMVWWTAKRVIDAVRFLIQPLKWVVNASKWAGEKIGGLMFDQNYDPVAANAPKMSWSGMAPRSNIASLPEQVASGAAVSGGVSTTTTNNSKAQNVTVNISGMTPEGANATAEVMRRQFRDMSMEAAGAF